MAGQLARPGHARISVGGAIGRTVAYVALGVLAVSIIYPLIWMALNGFKSNAELFGDPWSLPGTWRWENFVKAWNLGVVRYLVNSIIVTVGTVTATVLVSSMAAYGLTRQRIPFVGPITLALLGGMMLAPTVALIPLFRLLQALHIFDTYWALIILYTAFRISFSVFLIRAYMITLSPEMEDAAVVDGANRWQIFWLVVMPLSRPIVVSAALLQALFSWNEFAFALVFINTTELKTLPVGLLAMQGRVLSDWPVLFAALTMAAIPMILLFLAGQRQFIRGLAEGFGKG
ncbi:MAG TPA: carbohydrate ABC transporter permease [Candidatus Limnocylindrales bacterium]|nr:carbohydrate ABC transporter permease [Candidatus Limnocylindrales bacterium]